MSLTAAGGEHMGRYRPKVVCVGVFARTEPCTVNWPSGFQNESILTYKLKNSYP